MRKNEVESTKKKNNMGELQPSSIQDIITNQGQGRKMKTEVRGEGESVASQATQPTAPSKSVAEEAKNLEDYEDNVDEWSISAPPVDEWSVPPPTESVLPTLAKEVEAEPRRSSKADSWSLSPEKEDEVDDWSIPAPTDDWSAPPKGELSISPQPKDDWCLSSPKEILNKDDWCLSSPKEILNSPVDEWSLPPVVPEEVGCKGGDQKVKERLLVAILETINTSQAAMGMAKTHQVKEEVVSSSQGQTFLLHLLEVYRIAQRISSNVESEQERSNMVAVERAWQSFVTLLPTSEIEGNHIEVVAQLRKEGSREIILGHEDEEEGVVPCALCAIGISQAVVVMEEGVAYHPQCVNFWVNCVDEVLPSS